MLIGNVLIGLGYFAGYFAAWLAVSIILRLGSIAVSAYLLQQGIVIPIAAKKVRTYHPSN